MPIAGVPNSTRLSQMLDDAAFALLVLTAEDEIAEGELQPRMNVVHEAGLFQGRLGFTKAIILVEEGCKEFSNVEGLGQIRFLKGRVSAAFESVPGSFGEGRVINLRSFADNRAGADATSRGGDAKPSSLAPRRQAQGANGARLIPLTQVPLYVVSEAGRA